MTDQPTEEELARWERRAPGWVVRCLKCGLTQPFGKYGIRLGAASVKKCTLGRCPRCKRICCHVVEKRRNKQA